MVTTERLTPRGIIEKQADNGSTIIVFRRSGFPWMPAILAVLLSFFVCLFLLILGVGTPTRGLLISLPIFGWIQLGLLFFQILFLSLLSWYLLGKTTFKLSDEEIQVTFQWCWKKSTSCVRRNEIRKVMSWQSSVALLPFLSKWSVQTEGPDDLVLAVNEGRRATLWLGRRIAQWAEVPFESASEG